MRITINNEFVQNRYSLFRQNLAILQGFDKIESGICQTLAKYGKFWKNVPRTLLTNILSNFTNFSQKYNEKIFEFLWQFENEAVQECVMIADIEKSGKMSINY